MSRAASEMFCPYCHEAVPLAGENEHTKAHALALLRTGTMTVRAVAAELRVTPGRVAAYQRRAGIQVRLFKRKRWMVFGDTPDEVERQRPLYEAHGFRATTPVVPVRRFYAQWWERA